MIKRIVVAVDFSDASCRAAAYAVDELAPQLKAEVVLVTVLEPSDLRLAVRAGLHGFATDEDVHRKVREWIEEQFQKIRGGSENVTRDVRRGLPDRELIEAIHEHKADLVVMGASGLGHRTPMGSKAEYVLKHAGVPLVLL